MGRIRIGLIGLSTGSAGTSWASVAHLPYLLSPQGQAKYEITALCNSSVESAQKSIKHYKLSDSVKSYGSPTDLANDPDIDLVACIVGVEKHHELLMPIIEAGKNVYTELPLASNMEQIRELAAAAEKKGVKTMFGSQGQASPVVKTVKKLISDGKIGNVQSTTLTTASGSMGGDSLEVGKEYFAERKKGGNLVSVFFLHSITCMFETFGELETFNSIMSNEHPHVKLVDPAKDGKVVDNIAKDTPDTILLQGRFKSGTIISYQITAKDPFPGEPGCHWIIRGDKGEILITNPVGVFDMSHKGVKIKLVESGSKDAQNIELPADELSELGHPSQNVGRLYNAFANGDTHSYADWKVALKRHEFLDEMWRRSDEKPYGEPAEYVDMR